MRILAEEDLTPERIAEIDVSEYGDTVYYYCDGGLAPAAEAWYRPRRDESGWMPLVEKWLDELRQGAAAVGAFENDLLVGIAVLRYDLGEGTDQLSALFVSRDHRRRGVASHLSREVVRLSRERGARRLYVSATPSRSAVSFYVSQGFRLAKAVNRELFELEPEDIHMVKTL